MLRQILVIYIMLAYTTAAEQIFVLAKGHSSRSAWQEHPWDNGLELVSKIADLLDLVQDPHH